MSQSTSAYRCLHTQGSQSPPQKASLQFSSVQSLSRVLHFANPWITARQASLSITNSRSSHKLMSIKSVMPSSHLTLCHPLLLLPPIPQSIRVFSNESTLRMRWPKYWSWEAVSPWSLSFLWLISSALALAHTSHGTMYPRYTQSSLISSLRLLPKMRLWKSFSPNFLSHTHAGLLFVFCICVCVMRCCCTRYREAVWELPPPHSVCCPCLSAHSFFLHPNYNLGLRFLQPDANYSFRYTFSIIGWPRKLLW